MWWVAFRGCWAKHTPSWPLRQPPALCFIIKLKSCMELGRQESGQRGRSAPGQDGLQQLGPRVLWRTCCPASGFGDGDQYLQAGGLRAGVGLKPLTLRCRWKDLECNSESGYRCGPADGGWNGAEETGFLPQIGSFK